MVNTTLAPPAKTTVKSVDESARFLRVGGKKAEKVGCGREILPV